MCFQKANKEREEIDKHENITNIKNFGDKAMKYKEQQMLRSVSEMIRIIDTIKEKREMFQRKVS